MSKFWIVALGIVWILLTIFFSGIKIGEFRDIRIGNQDIVMGFPVIFYYLDMLCDTDNLCLEVLNPPLINLYYLVIDIILVSILWYLILSGVSKLIKILKLKQKAKLVE